MGYLVYVRSIKLRILLTVFLASFAFLISPTDALAAVQNLNGQTGQTQSFANDTNVVINSANDVHTLGWFGLLPISRGGTGNDAFAEGSIIFMGQNKFRQDNNNFFWDRINNRLGLGTSSPTSTLDVVGNAAISDSLTLGSESASGVIITPDAVGSNTNGPNLEVSTGNGVGDGSGGSIGFETGSATNGNGGNFEVVTGQGDGPDNSGGTISLYAGNTLDGQFGGQLQMHGANYGGIGGGDIELNAGHGAVGGSIGIVAGSGGTAGGIILTAGSGATTAESGIKLNPGSGPLKIIKSDYGAILGISSITGSDKTFTFPNFSGTFGLLEANQTWTGLNKFEAGSNSTIYVGSSIKSGCIAMGDSDGSGITYVTANDGVLAASSTKPSICQ